MTDSWNTEPKATESPEAAESSEAAENGETAVEEEDATLLGHDPVLGPSDPEADEHGDNLTRVDEDQL